MRLGDRALAFFRQAEADLKATREDKEIQDAYEAGETKRARALTALRYPKADRVAEYSVNLVRECFAMIPAKDRPDIEGTAENLTQFRRVLALAEKI